MLNVIDVTPPASIRNKKYLKLLISHSLVQVMKVLLESTILIIYDFFLKACAVHVCLFYLYYATIELELLSYDTEHISI